MKKKKFLLVMLLVIVLIISLIFIFIRTGTNNKDITKSTNEIIEQNAKNECGNETYNMTDYHNNIFQYEDWIIFSKGNDSYYNSIINYKDGVYKYNIKTGQVIKLYDDNGYNFNIKGNVLYFLSNSSIRCINLVTLESNWVGFIKANYLLIYNKYIYYRDDNGNNIYRIKNMDDSHNKKLIAEYTTRDIQIYNDYIYYIDANSFDLLKKSIKDTNDTPIKVIDETDDVQIQKFYVSNDKIIYITIDDNNDISLKIYNSKFQTKELIEKSFSDSISANFVLSDNGIIYSSSESGIVEIDMDTKNKTVLRDKVGKIDRLQLFNNNIFYYETIDTYQNRSLQLYSLDINTKKQEKLYFNTYN